MARLAHKVRGMRRGGAQRDSCRADGMSAVGVKRIELPKNVVGHRSSDCCPRRLGAMASVTVADGNEAWQKQSTEYTDVHCLKFSGQNQAVRFGFRFE